MPTTSDGQGGRERRIPVVKYGSRARCPAIMPAIRLSALSFFVVPAKRRPTQTCIDFKLLVLPLRSTHKFSSQSKSVGVRTLAILPLSRIHQQRIYIWDRTQLTKVTGEQRSNRTFVLRAQRALCSIYWQASHSEQYIDAHIRIALVSAQHVDGSVPEVLVVSLHHTIWSEIAFTARISPGHPRAASPN